MAKWMFDSVEDFGSRKQDGVTYGLSNIRYTAPVYRKLDSHAVEGIRSLVRSESKIRLDAKKVHKVDSETVEVVFEGPHDDDPSHYGFGDIRARELRRILSKFYGDHWRAEQKIDKRYDTRRHSGRVVIRCVEAYRFTYQSESNSHYERMLHGAPEGVPEDAQEWSDVFPSSPSGIDEAADLWVYETSSGTQHFVPAYPFNYDGWASGFFDQSVVKPVSFPCGHEVEPSEVVEEFEHYRNYAVAHAKTLFEGAYGGSFETFEAFNENGPNYALNPRTVLDNPCQSCLRSYGAIDDDGDVTMPSFKYSGLVDWGVEDDD